VIVLIDEFHDFFKLDARAVDVRAADARAAD
jgi:hypothetical protein